MSNGIFGKKAIGSADGIFVARGLSGNGVFTTRGLAGSDGVFSKRAMGSCGCFGCGAVSEGTKARRRGMRGFGDVTIPAACWDKPGFKDASDQCLVGAQQSAAQTAADADAAGNRMSSDEQAALEAQVDDVCHQTLVDMCNAGKFDTKKTPATPPAPQPKKTTPTPNAKLPATTPAAQPASTDSSMLTGSFWGLPTIAWISIGGALALVGIAKAVKASRERG